MSEPQPLVQRNAARVRGINAANHAVHVPFAGSKDQLLHHPATQARAAMVLVNVDRVLHGVLVGRPGPERSEAAERGQVAALVFKSHDRKAALGLVAA